MDRWRDTCKAYVERIDVCSAEIHRKSDTEIHAGHMYLFIEDKRAQHGSKNKKSFFYKT
jgi:hypothetical protein